MASAHAGDLGNTGLKDPIPDSLSWQGVTIYGTVDVGYAYQTHGAPLGGAFYPGLEYNLNGSRNADRAISSLAENALEQSKIGVKVEEAVGYGFLAIGKLETAFNPVSGELADACASMIRNNGKPYQDQSANSDGSRCGQAFNGSAYGGVSNPIFGTLTVGRQQSLELDAVSSYDPMGLAPGIDLLGYSGGTSGGFGATETARWDESIKYVFTYGPAHAAAMYTAGGPRIQPSSTVHMGPTSVRSGRVSRSMPFTRKRRERSFRHRYLIQPTQYAFNKHWDAYAGISYMENGGGLNSAYLNDNMVTFVTGMRLKF